MEFSKSESQSNFKTSSYCKGSVLLIEDSEETALAIVNFLDSQGFEVHCADTVKGAIEFLAKSIPDLILSDINLPLHSGIDLFKETRSHYHWREIPFIFISGDGNSENKQLGISLGADNFITKPFQPEELKAIIEGKILQIKTRQDREKVKFENLKRRIIHTLSHEFRTPLVSITTGTELLLDEYHALKDEQVQTLLRSILKGGQRLERLVEDFMTMQQIDTGYAEQAYNQRKVLLPIDEIVETLSERTRELCKYQYSKSKIIINVEPEIEETKIEIFPDQFVDALLRLIDNGMKFSENIKDVKIDVKGIDGKIAFIIRDWGKGLKTNSFASEQLSLAFEQIDREINEQQGCGLGLSIASYFLTIHGAETKLSSPDDGVGTKISVYLKPKA